MRDDIHNLIYTVPIVGTVNSNVLKETDSQLITTQIDAGEHVHSDYFAWDLFLDKCNSYAELQKLTVYEKFNPAPTSPDLDIYLFRTQPDIIYAAGDAFAFDTHVDPESIVDIVRVENANYIARAGWAWSIASKNLNTIVKAAPDSQTLFAVAIANATFQFLAGAEIYIKLDFKLS